MNRQFTVDAIDAAKVLNDGSLVTQWNVLMKQHSHLNAMFASPAWISHLVEISSNPIRLWLVRDESHVLVGLVAARLAKFELQFAVKNRKLFGAHLTAAHVMGSLPLLPDSDGVLERVTRDIFDFWGVCQCLYLDALPTDSTCWEHLGRARWSASQIALHVVDGPRPWWVLNLDNSFDDYLKTLSAKARAALRRKARQAGKSSRGAVNVRCCTSAAEVSEFLTKAVEVSQHSWQYQVLGERVSCDETAKRSFEDLAHRGILRAYLLELGTTPCAFVIGYQHDGVYHYSELGFREDCSNLSPGTVLLFYIIEDLHKRNAPVTLNFGVGDASYKQRFGNEERSDVSCLLLRKTMRTRLLVASHSLFNWSLSFAKKVLGRSEVTK